MLKIQTSNYPFGSSLPNLAWSDVCRRYRYEFNTQEKDNEIAGESNSYTAEFWQYDGKLGRRWNLNPIVKESISLYICFNNNYTNNTDKNGVFLCVTILPPQNSKGGTFSASNLELTVSFTTVLKKQRFKI